MTNTFNTHIVTPDKSLETLEASLVEVPGEAGNFGVLKGHAPMIAGIRPGTVHVHLADGTIQRYFIAGGLAEVTPDRCTILAEHAEDLKQISATDAHKRLEESKHALTVAVTEEQKTLATREVTLAEALVSALKPAHG